MVAYPRKETRRIIRKSCSLCIEDRIFLHRKSYSYRQGLQEPRTCLILRFLAAGRPWQYSYRKVSWRVPLSRNSSVTGGAKGDRTPDLRATRAPGGIEPPGRARVEGRSARNDLLFVATFAAPVMLLSSVDSVVAIPLLAPLPALLVALLFALAAVRRCPLLRLARLFLGSLCTIGGFLVSLIPIL
jgi:hypothetical protein